ncbi:ATP-binding protein [Streptomyces nanshensis]|uniref:ATP-binding protein n=1 Tax=Streptomyces nanshensis TaxID=518642 RepID=UPI000AB49DBA|nr:ATP-binding protein [Streptomyces nanshensis]
MWPAALLLAAVAVVTQMISWWTRAPAVMASGSVAVVGLLACLPHLWRMHREDIRTADSAAHRAEQAKRAAEAQVSSERAQLTEQWQKWSQSQFEAFHESVEAWGRDLRTVLAERHKPDASYSNLSPQTAKVLTAALDEVDEELVDVQDACEHAIVFLAQRLQTGGLQIQEKAGALIDRPEPGLPELGLEIDHLATTFAHHAQSLRILGGSFTGQQWQETVPLTDLVRAAGGQITDYQRVVIGGEPDLGVKDFAAEWLIHLVAELLGNATTYSPSSKEVTAQLEAVPSGAVIQIDDRGTGMTEARLQRALELVSGPRDVSIRDLQTPQVGLAVVGNIARRLKLRVSLGRSPYGGIRAVVLVPMELLEAIDPVYTMPVPEGTAGPAVEEAQPTRVEPVESAPWGDNSFAPQSRSPQEAPPLPRRSAARQPEPAPEPTPAPALAPEPPALSDPSTETAPAVGLPRRRSPRHNQQAAPAEAQHTSIGSDDDPDAAASFMSSFVMGGRTDDEDTDSPQGDDAR